MSKKSCPPHTWKYDETITGMKVKTCRKCGRTEYFYPTVVGGRKSWHLNPPG